MSIFLIGIAQAAEFNRKWKEAAGGAAATATSSAAASPAAATSAVKEKVADEAIDKDAGDSAEKATVTAADVKQEGNQGGEASRCAEFLSASAIFASPLTRAIETALVGCAGHPYFKTPGAALHLMRSAREVRIMCRPSICF